MAVGVLNQALGLVSVPGDHIFNMFVSNSRNSRNMFNLFHQNWDDPRFREKKFQGAQPSSAIPGAVCGSGSTEGGTAERKELVEAGGKPLEDEFFSMRQMAMEHFFLEHPFKQLFRCSPGMGLDP